ncbi:MAG: rod shape-determining protein MreC [Desulfocucumaceae bacterium]
MFRRGNTKKIILMAILIASTLLIMNFTEFSRVQVSPMESATRDILAPLQGLTMNLGHRLRGLVSFPLTLFNAAEENQLMKNKVTALEGMVRQLNEVKNENDRLKKQLDFKSVVAPAAGFEVTSAAVIGRDPGNWFGMITVNKGSKQGMRPNMAVISDQGLVGRITSVSGTTSEILLITDPRSGVTGLVQESRAPGIVEGVASYPGQIRMVHIPVEIDIARGQAAITSGLGSIYPKGIPIGLVQESGREPSGLFNSAFVDPFVDFNQLEEVMIITSVIDPRVAASYSDLPYPWGQGKTESRESSPGILNAGDGTG